VESFYNGRFLYGLDDKRRIQFPAKWRGAEAGEQFALIVWPHGSLAEACLLGLTISEFKELANRFRQMPYGDSVADSLRRLVGSNTETVTVDKSGRITLPDWMTKAVGIEKQAMLTGMVTRFQIWEPERFKTANQMDMANAAEAYKRI
jgi:MraZ protein